MKRVLSLLLAFIFLQVQTWALSGGPDYSKDGAAPVNSLIGTYSGVLIPDDDGQGGGAASIGLFSVSVPATGLATGGAIIFVDGSAFSGNVLAVGDPDESTLSGIFSGVSSFEVIVVPPIVNGNVVIPAVTSPVTAQGNVKARIIPGAANAFSGGTASTRSTSTFFTTTTTTTDVGTNDGARVVGTAEIDTYFQVDANGTPITASSTTFTIDGFKQSNTVSTTTTDFGGFFF